MQVESLLAGLEWHRAVLLLSCATAATYVGLAIVRRVWIALFSPLAELPGPKANSFTCWPLSLSNMAGKRVMYLHELSQQYGPIVRIGPQEVSVNSLEDIKTVHKMGTGFHKPMWYELSTGEDGKPGMFAMRDPKMHGDRRKLFARQFSKNGMADYETVILSKFELAVKGMRKHAVDDKVDLMVWWAYLATDLIGELVFGESFHTLEHGEPSQYNKDMQQTSFIAGLRAEFPTIVRTLWHMPIPSIVAMKEATVRVAEMGTNAYLRYVDAERQGTAPKTFFSGLHDKISVDLAQNEAKNLLIAGSDTTMVTLTYLVWAVLKHEDVKAKVVAEVASLESEYTIADAEALPYVANVIQESLRLYGAGPGSLPRSVPKDAGVLGGFYLPPGTVVSTQAYIPHRDPTIYVQPERFNPDRWDNATAVMKDALMPFGGGSRVCLGQHLARVEMVVGLVEFFRNFPHASIPPETTDESMAFQNYFLVQPVSHRCVVKLGP